MRICALWGGGWVGWGRRLLPPSPSGAEQGQPCTESAKGVPNSMTRPRDEALGDGTTCDVC